MNVLICLNYNTQDQVIWFLNENKEALTLIDKIIIVDNNSNDCTKLEAIQSNKIVFLQTGKNSGYAVGNNFGIKYAFDNYENLANIVVSNSDIIVSKECLSTLFENLAFNKTYGLVSPLMKNANGSIEYSAWRFPSFFNSLLRLSFVIDLCIRKKSFYKNNVKLNQIVDAVQGSLMVFKADALKAINYFDEGIFLYSEEDIIGYKLKQEGFDVALITDEQYLHCHDYKKRTIKNYLSHYLWLNKDKLYFLKKYKKINWLQSIVFKGALYLCFVERFLVQVLRKIVRK